MNTVVTVTNKLGTFVATPYGVDMQIRAHLPNSVNALRIIYAGIARCDRATLNDVHTVTELLVMLASVEYPPPHYTCRQWGHAWPLVEDCEPGDVHTCRCDMRREIQSNGRPVYSRPEKEDKS
jgi:hypothetical protein